MKYIEAKESPATCKFYGDYAHFKYAARVFVERWAMASMIQGFNDLYKGLAPDSWKYHWTSTSYPGQYELIFYTHELDWQVLNRLHGDVLPYAICTIYHNRELV